MSLPPGLFARPIAHRGLWSPQGPPENSLPALRAATEAGYGVEFDVRLTADDVPVLLHDETLERMTGAPGRIADHSLADLAPLRLAGSDAPIPTLRAALSATAGALRLIELKGPADPQVLGPAVDAELGGEGDSAVISFHPALLAWFARERPHLPRGLDWEGDPEALPAGIEASGAQFLLLDLPLAFGVAGAAWRGRGRPVIAWTVRTEDDLARARAACDNLIFEGLRP